VKETKRQKYEILRAQLELEASSFRTHWGDLSDFILPRRSRFNTSDVNRGDRRNQKIIDSTATLAARTLQAGMMSGVTSPARPWFRLTTPDPDLSESNNVKVYLHDVTQRMNNVFLRSNIYNIFPTLYGDLGVFGTAAMSIEESFNGSVIHCTSFPIGSYRIAKDYMGRVNTFSRDFKMTVRQLIQQFGKKDMTTGTIDWSIFSLTVKNLYERGDYEQWIDVRHIICPNEDYDPNKLHSKYKKFESCYYESGSGSAASVGDDYMDKYLRQSGYDYFPILAPRWEVTGEDTYGTSCPGMVALGDIRQLQTGERRGGQALEKMINPPMVAPTSMMNSKSSILPGDINYVDVREGNQGFRPAHIVDLRLDLLEQKQQQIRQRIQKAFYEDLFLMLANDTRSNITAREIDERHEEKLLALGPVLEQLGLDVLDPAIDITYDIMNRQGLLPPPPEELQGVSLKIEYISVMAQAQKLVGLAGIERFAGFVGQLAAASPAVMDKVDTDQMVDEYGDACGISPKIVRSDEDVQAMRQQQAEAQAAQQKAEMIKTGAGAAKDLSQANMDGDNALTRIIDQANAGAGS